MKRQHHGYSVTELMVATLLLSIVIAGGLTALTRAGESRNEAAAWQQLHERAQYVYASLEPDLQMAGYFGLDAPPRQLPAADIPDAALRCGLALVQRLDLPLQVAATWDLPCAARGGGAVPGSQVLTVRRASAQAASGPERGRAQWQVRPGAAASGRLFWQGEAAAFHDGGPELRELLLHVYYVARAADGDTGTPALRMKSLTSIAGQPAFIDTEVMPGVEDLQVRLLPEPTAPRIASVRLRLRAGTTLFSGKQTPHRLEIERQFTLRNALR